MSRISINRRIERLRDFFLPPGTLEHALENLKDDMRAQYQTWRVRADAIVFRHETEPGAAFAAMLDDPLLLSPMPRALELALFPYMAAVRFNLEPAHAYQLMLEGN